MLKLPTLPLSFGGSQILQALRRLPGWLRKFVDWRPLMLRLPRRECHYINLEVRGVPTRAIMGSIRLQLIQLTGVPRLGFAFQVTDGRARVWYWDENRLDLDALTAGKLHDGAEGFAPWPESILHQPQDDGLHLWQLDLGYEALAIKERQVYRTRWFPTLPDETTWASFVRDAGLLPSAPLPLPCRLTPLQAPPKGWKLYTTLQTPIGFKAWAIMGAVALLGSVTLVAGLYQLKLELAIDQVRNEVNRISGENASTIALQQQIDKHAAYIDLLRQATPKVLQLELMEELIGSGLIDVSGKISLLEWEYRNNQLRLMFGIPAEGFALGDFLTRLEALPMFKEIRLLPDTPPRTLGVQTVLAPRQVKPRPAPETESNVDPQADLSTEQQ